METWGNRSDVEARHFAHPWLLHDNESMHLHAMLVVVVVAVVALAVVDTQTDPSTDNPRDSSNHLQRDEALPHDDDDAAAAADDDDYDDAAADVVVIEALRCQ